ncbi:MAG: hypothetical protein SX243_14170 [Acidobacteriota bacterium]|nr:hypothetical protein [Acidobacteriota bacterium]
MPTRDPARRRLSPSFLVVVAGLWLLTAAWPAYAYLDPASGSMFLQLLLGGIAGAALFFKLVWHRIRDFFRPGTRREQAQEQAPD